MWRSLLNPNILNAASLIAEAMPWELKVMMPEGWHQ
jgi:hypothetical protein